MVLLTPTQAMFPQVWDRGARRGRAGLYRPNLMARYLASDSYSDSPPVTKITVNGTAIKSLKDQTKNGYHTVTRGAGSDPTWQTGPPAYADFSSSRLHDVGWFLDPQNFFFLGVVNRAAGFTVSPFNGDGTRISMIQWGGTATNQTSLLTSGNGNFGLPFVAPAATDYVIAFGPHVDGSVHAYQNLQSFKSHYGAYPADASYASHLNQVFGDGGGRFWRGRIQEMDFWNAPLSDVAALQSIRAVAAAHSITMLATNRNLVCKGDSLTYSNHTTSPGIDSWPAIVVRNCSFAPERFTLVNSGKSGQGLGVFGIDQATSMLTSFNDDVQRYYNPKALRHILLLHAGTNDLQRFARTALQLEADYFTYVALARANGWSTVVSTIIPRADVDWTGPMETERTDFNTWLLLHWSDILGAEAVVDPASRANLSDPTNTTYFRSDKLHLTDLGYAEIAAAFQPALDTLAA